jgi:hypothetical protein
VLLESGVALPWPSTSPDAFTDHTRYELSASARERNGRVLASPLERDGVTQLVRRLGVGELRSIRIEVTRPWTDTDLFGASVGHVEVDQERASQNEAHYLEARLSAGPLWDRFAAWQDRVVAIFTRSAAALTAPTGLLTVDAVPVAHEYSLGIPAGVGRSSVQTRVRGYAWGTILSGILAAALGGRERVRAEAPVAEILDLGRGPDSGIYLQLTPNIDDFSDEALRKLKNYLLPILDTHPRESWVVSPRIRVV